MGRRALWPVLGLCRVLSLASSANGSAKDHLIPAPALVWSGQKYQYDAVFRGTAPGLPLEVTVIKSIFTALLQALDRYDTEYRIAFTGGKVFGDEACDLKFNGLTPDYFGLAGEVVVTKEDTVLLKGRGKELEIKERKTLIEDLISDAPNNLERTKHMERLARLNSKVAIISVGGGSEVEVSEKKDRVEDALQATRAALEDGIVPGGGVALLSCMEKVRTIKTDNEDQKAGVQILMNSLKAPLMTIAHNAGVDPTAVLAKVLSSPPAYGYDVMSDNCVDMMKAGIIDPTKVVKTALYDAAIVASLLTTTEAAITFVFEGDEIPLH